MYSLFSDKCIRRFVRKVGSKNSNGCCLWLAGKSSKGYGCFYPTRRNATGAHRFAWELANEKKIPGGLFVCHACDVPSCCNPEHLFLGTNLENMRDMANKKRTHFQRHPEEIKRGEKSHMAKLTDFEVSEIRKLKGSGLSQSAIGKMFGVCQSHVGVILNNKIRV